MDCNNKHLTKRRLLSSDITTGSYDSIVSRILGFAKRHQSTYVCVANVHMLIEAHKDEGFSDIVNNADITTADGMPLVFGLNKLYNLKQQRVAGMDLILSLLEHSEQERIGVYFYGSTDNVLAKVIERCKVDFPSLVISGAYSPPFRQLTDDEHIEVATKINSSGAGLVLVALGCPKQEKWMNSMKGKVHATMVGLGGAFPVYARTQPRAPRWMQKSGLEWLYRLQQEPGRLWKRYLTTNTLFVLLFIRDIFKTGDEKQQSVSC